MESLPLQNDVQVLQLVCLVASHRFGVDLVAILGGDNYKLKVTGTRILKETVLAILIGLRFRLIAFSRAVEKYFELSSLDWFALGIHDVRSEERRVGKECRSRWSPYH